MSTPRGLTFIPHPPPPPPTHTPSTLLQHTQSPRAKSLGRQNCFLLLALPGCALPCLPLPEILPRAPELLGRDEPTLPPPKSGLEEVKCRLWEEHRALLNCPKCNFFFFFFSGVFNKKSQLLVILLSILVPSLICIVVPLIVWKKKRVAGFLSSYLSFLQGFRDFESGVPFTCFGRQGKRGRMQILVQLVH